MSTEESPRPRVAVMGGCGFIGRHMVELLVSSRLASEVRVVDKTPPQTAWMNKAHTAIFESELVEFRSANLINPASCAASLEREDGAAWDVVLNCAGETKCGQTDAVYSEGILTLSVNVARVCAARRVGRLLEISSGCLYSSEKVMYVAASCAASLEREDGAAWDVVLNCAGETKCGQTDAVYSEGILTLSVNVALTCAARRVGRLLEISSGCLYSSEKTPHAEDGPLEPWTVEARYKRQVEEQLAAMRPELHYTVLRPALVYGIADRRSLMPRLLVGGVYKHLRETMKLLWGAELKLNTVHARDVCRAAWLLATRGDTDGAVYNVVDDAASTQGSLTDIIADIYGIGHDYVGTAMSLLAQTDIAAVAEEANDKHLSAWALACAADQVTNTPLEPSTPPEMLLNRHLHLDGSKLRALGFRCDVPRPTAALLREVLDDYVEMGLFPKSLLL